MKAKPAPMTREQWRIAGELDGHTVEQTIRYLSDCDDYAAEQARVRALPVGAVPADAAEPRFVTRLRRWVGR